MTARRCEAQERSSAKYLELNVAKYLRVVCTPKVWISVARWASCIKFNHIVITVLRCSGPCFAILKEVPFSLRGALGLTETYK